MSQKITVLEPNCIATDGTYLYAHALLTIAIGGPSVNNQNIVLVQSNPNPSSLTDISWKVVSTINQSKLYILQGLASIKSFNCHVDSNGVFTILATSSKSFSADQAPSRVRGYQFDPTGGGSWTNVDVTDNYKWSIIGDGLLFSTGSLLMHAFNSDVINNTITVSIFNSATHTFVAQNTSWALPTASGRPYSLAVGNGNMYVMAGDFISNTASLNVFPLSPTGGAPAATSIKVLTAPQLKASCPLNAGTVRAGLAGTTYYMFCSDAGRQLNYLVSSDGNTVTAPATTNTSINSPESFIPMKSGTWAFMNTGSSTFSLTLTGNVGAWQVNPNKINTSGLSGTGPNGSPDSGSPDGSSGGNSGGGGGISTSAVIAIVVCCVLVVAIVSGVIWRRKRRKAAAVKVPPAAPVTQQPVPGHQGPFQGAHQGQFPVGHQQIPHSTYPVLPPTNTAAQYGQAIYPTAPAPPYTTAPIVYEIKGDLPPSSGFAMPATTVTAVPQSSSTWENPTSTIISATTTLAAVAPSAPQTREEYQAYPQGTIRNPQQYPAPGAPQGRDEEPIPTTSAPYIPGPQGGLQDTGNHNYHQ
ncbi:hypothetical protein B0O80DRAFT_443759 [Mortierella sp. GBAus27b]|nr:hypothetical protein B0O80DRAFT_443759 [Mortierella sp. GBAus27b]